MALIPPQCKSQAQSSGNRVPVGWPSPANGAIGAKRIKALRPIVTPYLRGLWVSSEEHAPHIFIHGKVLFDRQTEMHLPES
jgi:hypothetical protein